MTDLFSQKPAVIRNLFSQLPDDSLIEFLRDFEARIYNRALDDAIHNVKTMSPTDAVVHQLNALKLTETPPNDGYITSLVKHGKKIKGN